MKEIAKYSGCFVCGEQNQQGIRAKFFWDGEQAVCSVTAERVFESYKHIYHGGIISTLLDEVMLKAILAGHKFCVTAEMTVRFHQPVPIGETLTFKGRIVKARGRLFLTEGEAFGESGQVYATASGKYVQPREDLRNRLMESMDS